MHPYDLPYKLFEALAEQTWSDLKDSKDLDLSLSEESITDYTLLAIKRSKLKGIKISKFNKKQESKSGADWEFWIKYSTKVTYRYSIQAKKVNFAGNYENIRHEVNDELQIEILKKYSDDVDSIPLYCFFNYSNSVGADDWNCNEAFIETQLGISVVQLSDVQNLIEKNKGKISFGKVHLQTQALPWRCLVKCPNFFTPFDSHPLYGTNGNDKGRYSEMPTLEGELFDSSEFPALYRFNELEFYPNYIITIDLTQDNFETSFEQLLKL